MGIKERVFLLKNPYLFDTGDKVKVVKGTMVYPHPCGYPYEAPVPIKSGLIIQKDYDGYNKTYIVHDTESKKQFQFVESQLELINQ